jgi:hypothetical protein
MKYYLSICAQNSQDITVFNLPILPTVRIHFKFLTSMVRNCNWGFLPSISCSLSNNSHARCMPHIYPFFWFVQTQIQNLVFWYSSECHFDVRLEDFKASSALRYPETRCCIVWQMDSNFPEAPALYVASSTKVFLSIHQITTCQRPGHRRYLF